MSAILLGMKHSTYQYGGEVVALALSYAEMVPYGNLTGAPTCQPRCDVELELAHFTISQILSPSFMIRIDTDTTDNSNYGPKKSLIPKPKRHGTSDCSAVAPRQKAYGCPHP